MKSGNCYKQQVDVFDLLVAEDSEFNLTRNKIYVAKYINNRGLVGITNDASTTDDYADEYFRFYEGESISIL